MTFEEILSSPILNLPISQNSKKNFRDFLFEIFDKYLELLNDLKETSLNIPDITATKKILIKKQTEFINGLKRTIDIYYDGYPAKAYEELARTLATRMTKYKNLLRLNSYEVNEDFYRIRKIKNNHPSDRSNFFHIPFNLRGKVGTQRFSIPGFPSLYLGRTVYVCWEELNRPNINEFQVARLKSISKIKYLDLSPPFLKTNLRTKEFYKYLTTWPLIAACAVIVKNPDDFFKPEYIMPQLLLQWVRGNKQVDGIRYWSTHVNEKPTSFNGEMYNLILPVKENKEDGLCDNLKSMFEITESISWQTHELALGGMTFYDSEEEMNKLNKKIPTLELIKGMKYPYSYSIFGKLEKYLNYLKTKSLE